MIGFGCIEAQERASVKQAILDALANGQPARSVLSRWNEAADRYNKMPRGEAPQRYTRVFWYENKLHFHHINREHAFSPDGWALMKVEEPFPQPGGDE